MKRHWKDAAFLVVCLALSLAANAATVTVTPDNMQGWSIVTNQIPSDGATCTAAIANYGYAVGQRNAPKAWVADDGTGLGKGAYYVTTEYGGWAGTPPSAWLGVDTFNGQSLAGIALNRITRMEYYSLNAQFPTSNAGGNPVWTDWTYRQYPKQPLSLQLTAQDPQGNRRQFWFCPYDSPVGSHQPSGDNSGVQCKQWLRFDCINFNTPCANTRGKWYCPDPEAAFASWADLIAVYGNYTLSPTSNDPYPTGWKSAGWTPNTTPPGTPACTATGMCLNFVGGARNKTTEPLYAGGSRTNWINISMGLRGYVDRFTFGIDGVNVTYDFEPSPNTPAPHIVTINNKAAFDALLKRQLGSQPPAQDRFLVKIVGQCNARSGVYAYIDDGSATKDDLGAVTDKFIEWWIYSGYAAGQQVKQNPAFIGEYWSAIGVLERSCIMKSTDKGMPIWTAARENLDSDSLTKY